MLTEGFYLLVDKRRPLRRRRAFFVLPAGRCFLRRWCALPSSAIVVFVIVVVSCRRLAKPVRTIAVGFGSQAENPYIEQLLLGGTLFVEFPKDAISISAALSIGYKKTSTKCFTISLSVLLKQTSTLNLTFLD